MNSIPFSVYLPILQFCSVLIVNDMETEQAVYKQVKLVLPLAVVETLCQMVFYVVPNA